METRSSSDSPKFKASKQESCVRLQTHAALTDRRANTHTRNTPQSRNAHIVTGIRLRFPSLPMMMTAPNNVASLAVVAGEENLLGEPSYKYLTADEMRGLGDDSMAIDVTHDEKQRAEVDGKTPSSSISATMVSDSV